MKSPLIFILGVATGAVATFIPLKRYYDKREAEELNKLQNDWIKDIKSKWDSENEDAERALQSITTPKAEDNSPDASISHVNGPVASMYDYSAHSITEGENVSELAKNAKFEHPVDSDEDDENGRPSIISDEEEGNLNWHEIECDYYPSSRDLLNCETQESVDIHDTVTQDILDQGPSWLIKNIRGNRRFIFVKVPSESTVYIINYIDEDEPDSDYDDDGGRT